MRIPARYSNLLFGGLLSGIQVAVVSGAVVAVTHGVSDQFLNLWAQGITTAWPISFPSAVVFAPLVKKAVSWLTEAHD
jgi:hypothetical protein